MTHYSRFFQFPDGYNTEFTVFPSDKGFDFEFTNDQKSNFSLTSEEARNDHFLLKEHSQKQQDALKTFRSYVKKHPLPGAGQ
jgi:hypothetical protein